MVRELFGVEPDAWQEEALFKFPRSKRLCMKACTGPGKTAVLAWLAWNFLLTRPHPIIGAASITGDNFFSNFWPEMARWRLKSPLLEHLFEQHSKTIFAKDHPETWRLVARTWPKDADPTRIGNTLRGLHGEYIMWLLDETGDYPESIMPIIDAIFSGNPKEAHVVQAGNPTKTAGPLYKACTAWRSSWEMVEITADPDDPKRTPRVSVEHAREQIKLYGADNPWVLVNIFGKFPPASFNSLIGPDEVAAAMKRYWRTHEIGDAPKIIGVDVARQGDDQSVIVRRQGIQMFKLAKYRNINSTQGAGQVARLWNDWNADATFIDMGGGFGSGWFDQLHLMGKAPIGVQFGGTAHQSNRYANKRTEMAFDLVEWIKRGGALPDDPNLLTALVETTYTFEKHGDRLILEPKEMVKKKLNGKSPDEMDGAMLTFAEPVLPKPKIAAAPQPKEWNPFGDIERRGEGTSAAANYTPFRD